MKHDLFRISPKIQSIAGIAYSKTHADTKKQELLLFKNVCMHPQKSGSFTVLEAGLVLHQPSGHGVDMIYGY